MAQHLNISQDGNLRGILWMITAMAAFAVEDSLLKQATMTLSIGQTILIFGLGGTLLFIAISIARGEPLYTPDVISRPMRYRVVFEITGRLFFSLAVVLTPLSSTTAILQATPIVVVAASAILFGEKVGWRRWAAVGLGLVGVLVIIQPGADGFSAVSLLAVIGMFGFAGRDLASRAAPATISTLLLGIYGFAALTLAGIIYAIWEGAPLIWPDVQTSAILCLLICVGAFAYSALMRAMRTGEVSAVAPFRYTRLIFGVGMGMLVFGEPLTQPMIWGCALIVLSGLFIIGRGRRA